MASKKIVTEVRNMVEPTEEVREASPTNNLVDAERVLREELLPDLARIKKLLYGGDVDLDLPGEPASMIASTWNVLVLSEMAAEIAAEILRRL